MLLKILVQVFIRVPVASHLCQNLVLSVSSLVGVKWYLFMVLISVSLMANDVELLFMCILDFAVYFLMKHLFKSFTHFLLVHFSSCNWVAKVLIYSGYKFIVRYMYWEYFSQSVTCLLMSWSFKVTWNPIY